MNKSNLNSSIIALGAFSACIAVAAGAFAAHGLKDVLNTEYLNTSIPLGPLLTIN